MKPDDDSDIESTTEDELDLQETAQSTPNDVGKSIVPTTEIFHHLTRPQSHLISEEDFHLAR